MNVTHHAPWPRNPPATWETRYRYFWGSSGHRFKSCQPDACQPDTVSPTTEDAGIASTSAPTSDGRSLSSLITPKDSGSKCRRDRFAYSSRVDSLRSDAGGQLDVAAVTIAAREDPPRVQIRIEPMRLTLTDAEAISRHGTVVIGSTRPGLLSVPSLPWPRARPRA